MTDLPPPIVSEPPQEALAPPEDRGDEVHIHKPKPLHGMREVLGEIGVIVLGILIAITLEQVVEQIHWAHEVAKARTTLRGEAAESNAVFRYRIVAGPCVRRRLDFLEALTERAAHRQPVPILGPIASNIDFALVDSAWQAQRASQVLTHFDDAELQRLGAYYFQLGTTQKLIGEEATSWRAISILEGDPARLSGADFANVRIAIKTARNINELVQQIAEAELDDARAAGLPTAPIAQQRLALACKPIETVQTAR